MSTTTVSIMTYGTIEPDSGLKNVIDSKPVDVIQTMGQAGLKGRGGAGFPTNLKWEFAAKAAGDKKYVICNAVEGEPGTFKDRVILSEYADLVFEGMTIAALAIEAEQGILYLRAEYTFMGVGAIVKCK